MKQLIKIILISILLFAFMVLVFSCQRKASPMVIYQDKIVTVEKLDTITIYEKDTCFDYKISYNNLVAKYNDLQKKYAVKSDTISTLLKEIQHLKEKYFLLEKTKVPKKMKDSNVVNIGGDNNEKIDNSNIDNTAKKGSAVGDGNDITNKKIDWWWIFIAGFLSAHLLRFIIKRFIL